jgi:hypothetical protein
VNCKSRTNLFKPARKGATMATNSRKPSQTIIVMNNPNIIGCHIAAVGTVGRYKKPYNLKKKKKKKKCRKKIATTTTNRLYKINKIK